MNPRFARLLITLTVAASAALLAGCLEQTRQAAQPVPVSTAPPAVGEPEIIARPDPAAANVSAPVAEVARLHLSGLDETVVKAFVEKSTNATSPTADELIYLKDIGVSPRVITAMIQQTARMREQSAAAAAVAAMQTNQPPASARPNITVINAPTPEPAAPPAAPAPAAAPAATPVAPAPQVAAAPAVQPAPASLPPQVNIFYQHLQPYGTWMQVADYGWCWQPSVVISSPGWRPYADRGRWLYTDHGWYWQSDYAWGWAPFHYGRWVHHTRSGWLWVPDNVWGPAWVVWRSSSAHCGWAPLPPSAVFVAGRGLFHGGVRVALNFDFGLPRHYYTFVPFNRFCDRNPYYYSLAPTVVQNVFNQTTIINNIEVNNNVVVNNGVPADRVATLTRTEIRKVTVREAAPQEASIARLDRLEKAGNDLVIYRPVLNPNAPVKPMALINDKGESRTVLVPAGALDGQKIKGRPVYDTTSTGVPVLTGYTTEPPATPAAASTVVINNTIATTASAPVASAPPASPAGSSPNPESKPAAATKIFGITPGGTVAKRSEERSQPTPTVIIPNPADNSLFRPLTPPQPVTSTPRTLTPAQPVTSTPQNLTPAQPVSSYQPVTRAEPKKPQPAPVATATTSAAPPATVTPPAVSAPSAPVVRAPAPAAPVQVTPAPAAPARSAPVVPTYTPPPRPTVTVPAPVPVQPPAPVVARPAVIVNSPPQPSVAPSPNNASPSKTEPEKRR